MSTDNGHEIESVQVENQPESISENPSYADKFSRYGFGIGIIAMFALPTGGNMIAAAIIGAVCGAGGGALGHVVGSFIDILSEGPPQEEVALPASHLPLISLLLGLLGLLAWLLPIIGLPVGIAGYFTGRKGKSTQKRRMALAGMGFSVACLCLSAVNSFFGVILAV